MCFRLYMGSRLGGVSLAQPRSIAHMSYSATSITSSDHGFAAPLAPSSANSSDERRAGIYEQNLAGNTVYSP